MKDEELLKKILATVERMERSGMLGRFFEDIPECTETITVYGKTYSEMWTECMLAASIASHDAEQLLARAKCYITYVPRLYEDYKRREAEIKNPDILKFIKDYEADQKESEEMSESEHRARMHSARRHGSLDYDLYVINGGNHDAAPERVRDAIHDALSRLDERLNIIESFLQGDEHATD